MQGSKLVGIFVPRGKVGKDCLILGIHALYDLR